MIRSELSSLATWLSHSGTPTGKGVLLRSLVAHLHGKTRLADADESWFENEERVRESWSEVERGWKRLVQYLRDAGVEDGRILPGENVLVVLAALAARWPLTDREPLRWVVRVALSGRYTQGVSSKQQADVVAVRSAATYEDACSALNANIPFSEARLPADYLVYENGASLAVGKHFRLAYYLWLRGIDARDWRSGARVTWTRKTKKERTSDDGEWHHVWPKKYLATLAGVDHVDVPANLALISQETNQKINDQSPAVYLKDSVLTIRDSHVTQQLVPIPPNGSKAAYESWLLDRASSLAATLGDYWNLDGTNPQKAAAPTTTSPSA